ncbi:MAG: OFA family MFS transporter [Candidatus Altiarchaeales archaeon]|nr:OFA family MFS transporter [Candidatus Altiarchaeales archaeon]
MKQNRWLIVVGALIVQLCLGAIYSWSIFVEPLKKAYSYSTTQTQIIFSLALASFALTMIFAGKWQDRKGPRIVATAGGLVLGLGYILAKYSGGDFLLLTLSVGLIGGAGIGLGYVCPIAACVKWFPDKRGMVTGLAVAGFGAGAWVFSKVGAEFIQSYGVLQAFFYLGLVFLVAVVLGAQLLKNPPEGWKPDGCSSPRDESMIRGKPSEQKKSKGKSEDYNWREMLKTKQFWILWIMFIFSATSGLMVIGILKPFGLFSGLDAATAGTAVGVLALFNGAGRITWGAVSDKLGRNKTMSLMFLLQAGMMFILLKMGSSGLLLAIASAWVGFNFGGNFALFPSATADYFGTKNVGVNYGFVFTAYGVAGILGPILGGKVFDLTGSYLWAFIPTGTLCLIAAVLALKLKNPHHKEKE